MGTSDSTKFYRGDKTWSNILTGNLTLGSILTLNASSGEHRVDFNLGSTLLAQFGTSSDGASVRLWTHNGTEWKASLIVTRATSNITLNGLTTINAALLTSGTISDTSYFQVRNLGQYINRSATVTGMIVIVLPYVSAKYDMINAKIQVYEYDSFGASSIMIGGHNWQSAWYNTSFSVEGNYNKSVRLAYNGTNYCIVLGETNSVWHYPQIHVSDLYCGYGNSNSSSLGSKCEFVLKTSESGYTFYTVPRSGMWTNAVGKDKYIAYPRDGSFEGSGSYTGYIRVQIPKPKSATMMKFDINIFNYSTNTSVVYHVAGYNFQDNSWYNVTAYCDAPYSNSRANLTVRFVSDGTNKYVCIGETNTTWTYVKIYITNIVVGHEDNFINWSSGWTVSISTTAFSNYTVASEVTNTNSAYTTYKLSSTPNNTTTFLRGDNTWTNTLTSSLNVASFLNLNGTSTERGINFLNGSTYWYQIDAIDSRFIIYTHNGSNWAEALDILRSNRNVGIGTNAPTSKLHISGGLLKITNNSNTVTIGSGNTSWCHFENSADIQFYFNKGVRVDGTLGVYNANTYMNSQDVVANRYMYCVNLNESCATTTPDTNSNWIYANSDGWLRKSTNAGLRKATRLGYFQSGRDFNNGTLVETDINYPEYGDAFLLKIEGNSYGALYPFNFMYQGYIYYDKVINNGGWSWGTNLDGAVMIKYNNHLCFWWPRQAYWQGFSVFCAAVTGADNEGMRNRVISITDVAKPTTSHEQAMTVKTPFTIQTANGTRNGSYIGSYSYSCTLCKVNRVVVCTICWNIGTQPPAGATLVTLPDGYAPAVSTTGVLGHLNDTSVSIVHVNTNGTITKESAGGQGGASMSDWCVGQITWIT